MENGNIDSFGRSDAEDIEAPESQPFKGRIPKGIAARFASWTAEVLKKEEPPRGLDAEILNKVLSANEVEDDKGERTDAYRLWAALTALTQEIKLQGRTFKQLHEALEHWLDKGPELNGSGKSQAEALETIRLIIEEINSNKNIREKEIRTKAEHRVQRETLGILLDMKDRLARGLDTDQPDPDDFKPSWMDRILGRTEAIDRLMANHSARKKGYQLSLERLDDALRSYSVQEIVCQGRPFDPHSMNAVDIEETDSLPDGQVVEVYLPGYEWNGEVFRTAQVKVTRRARAVNEVLAEKGEQP